MVFRLISTKMVSIKCFIIVLLTVAHIQCWNTCDDEEFCKRIRNAEVATSPYVLDLESIVIYQSRAVVDLVNTETKKLLKLSLTVLEGEIFRIQIDDPDSKRHSVPEALDGEPATVLLNVQVDDEGSFSFANGRSTAHLYTSPFKIEVRHRERVIAVINNQGRLTYNTDRFDNSIALDFSFPEAARAYGIPEHAEHLSLKTTRPGGLNPYRLYNVDYPAYPISTQEALYGAVPVLYAQGTEFTAGIFWLNSAQTFVDINNGEVQVDSLFISESGSLDFFVLTGPTLASAVKQYTKLTGPAPLPQLFAIGHHQCRWSYMSQEEAETVVREFDKHDFPLDVLWLDIDYTDSFKYFTWDYDAFPNPVGMQEYFNSTGRKLVVIIDPHYKVEEGYFVYDIAKANGYFVKYANGTVFEGNCWPGLSSYMDYHNPETVEFYSGLFGIDEFPDGTDILYIWNDMNEPSVFDVHEKTMPRELVHYGGWEHRDVHNMYGFTQTVGTHKGLLDRYDNKRRPFVLTRSHFAGSQRYTAVWTGDNAATWEHLKISFPMCLTLGLAGISFCGADVGGFEGNVEDELLQRWYQAGAWLPFFRQHSSMTSDRREPYLYPEDIQARFRKALRERYFHLPMWYTLFFEHERYGDPVIRPLSYHYQSDPYAIDMDDQWLVGSDILVHPVTDQGATEVIVYFPGGPDQLWVDVEHRVVYRGIGHVSIRVDLDYTPVFYRCGSITTRRDTVRPSSAHTHDDPYNIYVFLDSNGYANGTLYKDDYVSFDYRSMRYTYLRHEYYDGALHTTYIDSEATNEETVIVGSITIYRPPVGIHRAVMYDINSRREFDVVYGPEGSYMVVKDLNVQVNKKMKIEFI